MSKEEQKNESDPFVLRSIYPDPLALLSAKSFSPTDLAQDCIFLLDTNVLLAPYRVGMESVRDVEKIYKALVQHKRLFVPVRALREFLKNRVSALRESFDQV